MPLEHVGASLFVDKDPLDADEVRRAAPKEWIPLVGKFQIHPWVQFHSLETASYGLMATEGDYKGEWVEQVTLGHARFSPETVADLSDLEGALETLREGKRYLVEEYPFSEIPKKEDYRRAISACLQLDESAKAWSPREKAQVEENVKGWEGPGVYDMRDCPPSLQSKSVEQYELEDMEYWADDTLKSMFQGDEWKKGVRDLLRELGRR